MFGAKSFEVYAPGDYSGSVPSYPTPSGVHAVRPDAPSYNMPIVGLVAFVTLLLLLEHLRLRRGL